MKIVRDKDLRLRVESDSDENAVGFVGHELADYFLRPLSYRPTDLNDSTCASEKGDYCERRMNKIYVFVVLVRNVAAIPRRVGIKTRVNAKIRVAHSEKLKEYPRGFPKFVLSFVGAVPKYVSVNHDVGDHRGRDSLPRSIRARLNASLRDSSKKPLGHCCGSMCPSACIGVPFRTEVCRLRAPQNREQRLSV